MSLGECLRELATADICTASRQKLCPNSYRQGG